MTITHTILTELMQTGTTRFTELDMIYDDIPATRCERKASCCKMLPDATLIEAVAVLKHLSCEPAEDRNRIMGRLIRYFFLNPVEMTACPFLEEQSCWIYEHRFFGCRSYGLWSNAYYEELSMQDREAKAHLQHQWQEIGVGLPDDIISFRQPYCTDLQTIGPEIIDDHELESISKRIESLSDGFSRWHEPFRNRYFSDISFFLTSAVMEIPEAVQSKFDIVRTILETGDRTKLTEILTNLPDILEPS